MQQATQRELFAQLEEQLSKKGCFLVVGDQSSPNFMTIGWATAGRMWGKPVMMIAVRLSRYSHDKLNELKEFTVCIPRDGECAKELAFAGVKSGRDFDKAEELGVSYLPAEKQYTPIFSKRKAMI